MLVAHDRYRVIRQLSSTPYGCVLACEDIQEKGKPALTAMASSVVVKQVSLERMAAFMRSYPADGHIPDNPVIESEVAGLVKAAGGHPNLVQYQDSFLEQKTLVLVMEHCADGDLYDYLSKRRQRTMSCSNALSVLSQVVEGLAFLHEIGVAHRDVSLENIMLHRGRCKLGDFGLATRARQVSDRHVGKNYYMAPEVVTGDAYDPKRADVWSLGIVLFMMLTGSPLVSLASTSERSFRALKHAGIAAVLQAWGVAASVSTSALCLLSGMLAIDPSKRLTIAQVLRHEALAQ
ncbi:NUAK SNF1-like kinase 1 [Phytophthora pseudosyringae]|uniref:NUAK SNF1-like kinase 1 n=1 Tax=Phytophthora pseudosyringae TaxID=221518 RepID=A0A8T1W117_9STRA|nr:NUAK SNF1-like kinase 1 [Phytophthora pseudosyringae]